MATTVFSSHANNAESTIVDVGGISDSDTVLTLDTGDGTKFPATAGGAFFKATITDSTESAHEIIKCTTRATDELSVILRAQDGTAARAWAAGSIVSLRPVNEDFEELQDAINNIEDGTTELATLSTAGDATIGDGTGAPILYVDGAEEESRGVGIKTAGSARWALLANDTAEAGSDAGSDLTLICFDDSGSPIAIPITITRSTGKVTLSGDLYVAGGYGQITGGPDSGDTFLVRGSGWCQQTIESTGASKDPKLVLKAVTASCTIKNDESDGNKLILYSNNGYTSLDNSGNIYIQANCSAESFTDRSPVYVGGNAAAKLKAIKPKGGHQNGWAEVDHETLGDLRKDTDATPETPAIEGRDIGKNIQLNSAAILELLAKIEDLEKRVDKLEKKKP